MPTTDELRALDHVQWALVLAVEDLPYAWTTHEDLVGTGLFSDGRQVLQGLVPFDYSIAIDPNADFQLKRKTTEIVIEDLDRLLVQALAGFDGTEVELDVTVEPAEDLALRTDLHDKQVGNERIGSSGERNLYPAVEGFSRPRLHVGLDYETDEVAAAPVSDNAVVLEGRRVVLYRVYRDIVTYPETTGFSTWRPLSEAIKPWWGTLRKAGHTIDQLTWTLQCEGPASWLYKPLGFLSQERGVRVWAPLVLDDSPANDQTEIRVTLTSSETDGANPREYGSGVFGNITADDTLGIRGNVSTALVAAIAAAGPDGAFANDDDQDLFITIADGILSIRIDGSLLTTRVARASLSMHESVWQAMGFDPRTQTGLGFEDALRVSFVEVLFGAPGYWEAKLTTIPDPNDSVDTWDNGGLPRPWKPLYPAGVTVLRSDAESSPLLLNLGDSIVHHSGQLDRPFASDPNDPTQPYPLGTGVNRQGLWLITGPRRFAPGQSESGQAVVKDGVTLIETFDEMQVAWASWREPAQEFAQVGGDPPQIVITKWLNPRDYGMKRDQLTTPWLALQNDADNAVYARPLLRLGYGPHNEPDQAHIVLQRLLYGTGQSAGWTGPASDNPTLPATSNEPAGAPLGVRLDGEVEDLGLQIPESFIQPPELWEAIADRLTAAQRKMSLAILPAMDTQTIMKGIMVSKGWGWSLVGRRYGLLDYTAAVDPTNAVVLDYSNKMIPKGSDLKSHKNPQTARAFTPKNRYVLDFDWSPAFEEFQQRLSQRSSDRGARYRPYAGDDPMRSTTQSASTHTALDHGNRTGASWVLKTAEISRWLDRGQFWEKGWPVMRRPGEDLMPGSVVLLTAPRAASPDGTYGVVAAAGIVARVLAKKGGRQYFADILVDDSSITNLRFNGPVAQARGYDAASRRLFVDDDHLESGGDFSDAAHFVEPDWSNLGGDAELQVRQWDGDSWVITATGVVESVDATPGASTITVAAPGLTGSYRRDDDAIVTFRPLPNQAAAWVLSLKSPICDEDGQWNTPDEAGYPWA